MKRLLLLSSLTACLGHPAPPDAAARAIDTWLDRWVEARRCLAADAEDTRTGVTIALLLGRICDPELMEVSQPTTEVLLRGVRLVDAIRQQPSIPAKRAAAIEAVDHFARDLGRRVGRDVLPPPAARALPVLQPKQRIDLEGMARFGGGVIHRLDDDAVIDQRGTLHEYVTDRTRHVPKPETEESHRVEKLIGYAEAGPQRVSVWSIRNADHAFEIEASSDGGAHWAVTEAPKGTVYLDSWQDPLTRMIEVAIRTDLGATTIHRITAQQPTPVVRSGQAASDGLISKCSHGGRHWLLGDLSLELFGERSMRLKNWSSLGELDCRGNVALVLSHLPDALERCTTQCEQVFASPNNHEGRGALLDDGRWIYAVELEQVVAIWREAAAAPTFHRLSKPASVAAITSFHGQPQLLIDDGKTRDVVPL